MQLPPTENTHVGKRTPIKVFVMTGPESSGIVAFKRIVSGKDTYEGYSWEIFEKVSKMPEIAKKYDFHITFSDPGFTNYEEVIDKIQQGHYDLGIAGFLQTAGREDKVDFTAINKIDSNAIFHVDDESEYGLFVTTIQSIGNIIFVIFLLGILLGVLLYFGNPGRMRKMGVTNKKEFFMKSIIAGIASMFGEFGYIAEEATLSYRGIFIATLIMVIAFVTLLYVQAKLTAALIEKKINSDANEYRLTKGVVLGHEGYAVARKIQAEGVNIKFIKDHTNDELFDLYMKNTDKYDGVALSYCDGYPYLTIYPQLRASIGFGNEPSGFPVRETRRELLGDLNTAILKLRDDGTLKTLCEKYFGKMSHASNFPTCSLS